VWKGVRKGTPHWGRARRATTVRGFGAPTDPVRAKVMRYARNDAFPPRIGPIPDWFVGVIFGRVVSSGSPS
jgi:hypothetical protein